MTSAPRGLFLVALALFTACNGPESGPPGELAAALPLWVLGPDASVVLRQDRTLGTLQGPLLPARLSNGDILVGDVGARELIVFRDGSRPTRISRQGDGPGELSGSFKLLVQSDTIITIGGFDTRFQINYFSPSDGFLTRFRLALPGAFRSFAPSDRLGTGQFVLQEGRGWRIVGSAPKLGALVPDSVGLALFRPGDSTGVVVEIGRVRPGFRVGHEWPGGPLPSTLAEAPLAPRVLWKASSDLLWVVDAESGEIVIYSGSGSRVLTDTLPLTRHPFDRAAVEHARSVALANARYDLDRAMIEAQYDPAVLPGTMPLLDALVAGTDGGLWIRQFSLNTEPDRVWLVVDRTGRARARAILPSDFLPHQVGDDFVLGVRKSDDGLEDIVLYQRGR